MSTPIVDIEIDGKVLKVEQGSMVIEAADKAGIAIPRFCYHKKLSIAANCRMCLVEVEKVGKPLPACATPVTAGMKVFTQSPKAREAQRSVMEFLLINHPLDCPICDQGGECELQDNSLEYGRDISRFTEGKRSVADEDLGPLVATEMTRCIQCTRCVRFGEEIAGVKELGVIGRGEHLWIGTYTQKSLTSEVSGNIIDLCPVGALTSKPFRFSARAWELTQHSGVAAHDCLGSNTHLHTLRHEVKRVVPRENEGINESWLSDRDRFSYLAIRDQQRLHAPKIKQNNSWQTVDWSTALQYVSEKLGHVIQHHSPKSVAALASPNSTNEELYLLQKLFRGLGCNNIDHRLQQTDFSDQDYVAKYPGMHGFKLPEIEKMDVMVLVGSHIHHEQPLAGVRVRKASLQGAEVYAINPLAYDYHFELKDQIVTAADRLPEQLAAIAKTLVKQGKLTAPKHLHAIIDHAHETDATTAIANRLLTASNPGILLGLIANSHPQAATIRQLSQYLASILPAKLIEFTYGANTAGAWITGAVPHREAGGKAVQHPGLTVKQAFEHPLKAYFLFGFEPDRDCYDPAAAVQALKQADFVVACTAFTSPSLEAHADVLLPISTFAETSGSYLNVEGTWQNFHGTVEPQGEARPGWKILRVLGNLFHLAGFDYLSSEAVRGEVGNLIDQNLYQPSQMQGHEFKAVHESHGLQRIGTWPIYQTDGLVRRTEALQKTPINHPAAVHINSKLAQHLNFVHGEKVHAQQNDHARAHLPVVIDERIPDNCVYIPNGYAETATLGPLFGAIKLEKETV